MMSEQKAVKDMVREPSYSIRRLIASVSSSAPCEVRGSENVTDFQWIASE